MGHSWGFLSAWPRKLPAAMETRGENRRVAALVAAGGIQPRRVGPRGAAIPAARVRAMEFAAWPVVSDVSMGRVWKYEFELTPCMRRLCLVQRLPELQWQLDVAPAPVRTPARTQVRSTQSGNGT